MSVDGLCHLCRKSTAKDYCQSSSHLIIHPKPLDIKQQNAYMTFHSTNTSGKTNFHNKQG